MGQQGLLWPARLLSNTFVQSRILGALMNQVQSRLSIGSILVLQQSCKHCCAVDI